VISRLIAAAVAVALLAITPAQALAASCPRTSVSALEDQVMCQVCGVPLGEATESPEAARERAFIARLAARCETSGQIKSALVAQYGPSVLALPPRAGFNVAAYLIPILGLLAAGSLVTLGVLLWRRRSARGLAPIASTRRLAPADAARVNAELEAFDR
jgi:cytochrome c-type biogenesis protein CcmH/NrfF